MIKKPNLFSFLVLAALTGCGRAIACDNKHIVWVEPQTAIAAYSDIDVADSAAKQILAANNLVDIRCWADRDNKLAQYALGYAYETGSSINADTGKARHYYKKAAASRSGRTAVYSPPVGSEKFGRIITVNSGQVQPGMNSAQMAFNRASLNLWGKVKSK